MRKVLAIVLFVLFIVAVAVSPSYAQRGRGMGEQDEGFGWGDPREDSGRPARGQNQGAAAIPDFLLMDLNLTGDQISKITELRETHFKEIQSLQEKIFTRQKDVKRLRQERPDLAELIQATQKEIAGFKKEWQDKRVKYLEETRNVLTPEQSKLLPSERMEPGDFNRGPEPGRGFGPGDRPGGPGMERRGSW